MVPPNYAAEMAPFDPMMGEYRVHYAGFFDPGFGMVDGKRRGRQGGAGGAEPRHPVRAGGRPDHRPAGLRAAGQQPDVLYGADLESNYQGQGLKLSKHFI